MIKIYGPTLSRAFRALWTAEELEVPYEQINLKLMEGEHRGPEYSRLNPMCKVPCLVDGDFVLTESAAICAYLADSHPDKGLIPAPRTPERALCDQWLCFVISELEQPLWTMGKHTFALPEAMRVSQMVEVAKKEWTRPAAALAAAVKDREVLVGDRFSVADIMAVHTLNWARGVKVALGHEALEAYRERHVKRPAFKRVLATLEGK